MEKCVATLIADPATDRLDDSTIAAARSALSELGAETGPPQWLAPGQACDVPFERVSPDQADAALRARVVGRRIDVVALPAANRRKKLLIADMDSTMIVGETLDELADFAGIKDRVAAITTRAMNGEIDFSTALRGRLSLLEGLPAEALAETYARVKLMPGAIELVRTMRANGAYTALVSGGFNYFTSRVRETVGFDVDHANELVIVDGRLAGKAREPILTQEAKLATLVRLATERGLAMPETLAVGDGANDLAMILAAGLGVAYHAKPIVASRARARIEFNDLTALLYAQGYRRDEFVR